MKKHFIIVFALLSLLGTMSLATTVNADYWGVSENTTYEWEVTEASDAYKNGDVMYFNTSFAYIGKLTLDVGDIIKFTVTSLNTTSNSSSEILGDFEGGGITDNDTDQANMAYTFALGVYTSILPGLISSIDWDAVKSAALEPDLIYGKNWTISESTWDAYDKEVDAITFSYDNEVNQISTMTYHKDSGVLLEGTGNSTMFTETSISMKITEDTFENLPEEEEETDWLLIGAIIAVVAALVIITVFLKRK